MTQAMRHKRRLPGFARIAVLAFTVKVLVSFPSQAVEKNPVPSRLKIGIVQMSLGATIEDNRDRIVSGIKKVAARGVRVVVLPEGALRGKGGDDPGLVEEAVAAIRRAARDRNVYVLFGGASYSPKAKKDVYWMFAVGPDGRDLFYYDKLYDKHDAKMPGVFQIDGVPCSAFLCADRWLRGVEEIPIQQGAQISFELSCNFASEWVGPYEWYWYVPRALRNNVWVIFANTGNKVSGASDNSDPRELRHGHSAVIAPDGRITAAARDDVETIVVAEVEVSQATRAEALARAAHPVLRSFWEAGLMLQSGQKIEAPPVPALKSPETEITLAVAQVTDNVAEIEAMIGQASAKHADLIVFPERATNEKALERLQAAARNHGVTVVVGVAHRVEERRHNSAFVLGPDGSVLTRYDQLSATSPFQPGTDPRAMWFRVKGVPAVVTIGRDALWTELAELAAVAGAQILVHLDHDGAAGREPELRRLQVGSNLASFHTFTATANVTSSAIWDDLRDAEERRAVVRGLPQPDTGAVEVYSPFSANLVVRAGTGPQLITATRRVNRLNPHHPGRTSNFNPQMDAWHRLGARLIAPQELKTP
jgi:predicted amidohydrolase